MSNRKCKSCGNVFEKQKPLQYVCSPRCALDYAIKEKCKKDAKTINDRVSKWKNEGKSISKLIMEARIPFQKWIRERDAKLPCISCGSTKSQIWQASHYLPANIFTGVIFDERNVWKSCFTCNVWKSGNQLEYRKALILKFGEEWVIELEEHANATRYKKYSHFELDDIKKKYQKKLAELKK